MKIGVIEGNGIGPEISEATRNVLDATGVGIEWVPIPVAGAALAKDGHPLPPESVRVLKEVGVTLKAPLIVEKLAGRITCVQPDGTEQIYPSLNNALRRELGLFVNPRPIRGFPLISGRYASLDMVIMREITEDVYFGQEHRIGDVAAEAIKLITRSASERVARFAFEFARAQRRRRVTILHKANVLNYTDGLFLRCAREVAAGYPDIACDDLMIDAACYAVVRTPERFDVVLAPNQYGDIFSDLGAGLIGSLGLAPGANIGEHAATFEASHGAAPDIAGKGIANPLALVLSGALLLRHVGHIAEATSVEEGVRAVLDEGAVLTPDLGGRATTRELAEAVVAAMPTRIHS